MEVQPDANLAACPSRPLMARIGEKWSVLAIVALHLGPLRFGELRRRLEGISQKMLSQTLRNLERDGLLTRTLYDERPVRVEYALTTVGTSLLPILFELKKWSEANLDQIETARKAYDDQHIRGRRLR